jgi:hypothetical protein
MFRRYSTMIFSHEDTLFAPLYLELLEFSEDSEFVFIKLNKIFLFVGRSQNGSPNEHSLSPVALNSGPAVPLDRSKALR